MKPTRSLFIAYFLAVVFTDSGGSYKITPSRGKFFSLFFFYILCLPCLNLVTEYKTNSPVCDHLSYSFTYMNYYGPLKTDLRLFLRLLSCSWFAASTRQEREVKVVASMILGYCLTVTILVGVLIHFSTHLPHLFKNPAIYLRQCHRGSGGTHGTWLHTFRQAHCVTEHLIWQLNINS